MELVVVVGEIFLFCAFGALKVVWELIEYSLRFNTSWGLNYIYLYDHEDGPSISKGAGSNNNNNNNNNNNDNYDQEETLNTRCGDWPTTTRLKVELSSNWADRIGFAAAEIFVAQPITLL